MTSDATAMPTSHASKPFCSTGSTYGDVLGVVMAAGFSRRFGDDDKRVCVWPPTGRTLLNETLFQLRRVLTQTVVVIRPDDDPQTLGLPEDVRLLRAPNALEGLGASIADALTRIEQRKEWQGLSRIALLHGDMPAIQPETLRALLDHDRPSQGEYPIKTHHDHQLIRPSYQGVPGHPVIFGRHYWPDLSRLNGTEGARQVLRDHSGDCIELPVNDPGVIADIDTPEALRVLSDSLQPST